MADIKDLYANLPARMRQFAGTERVPTGSIIFDLVLGGGIPRGASIGIASEPGAGKSTLLLNTAKSYCQRGLKVIYLDFEKGVTPSLIEGIGLSEYLYSEDNPNGTFFMLWPDTFGDGERIVDTLIPDGDVGLCVIDSATFMLPDNMVAEKEKERVSLTATRPGEQAQLMSKWVEKYLCFGNRYGTSFIYVQQMRTKISFVQTTVQASGGYALKHALSASVMLKRDSYITRSEETMEGKDDNKVGANVRIWCEKSRISRPFVEGVLTILFGKGVSNIYTYMKWLQGQKIERDGKELKCLSMAGAGFWTMQLPSGEYKARGEAGAYKLVQEHKSEIQQLVDSRGGFKLIVSDKGE